MSYCISEESPNGQHLRAELIKWMFVVWAGTLVPLGGLILFLVR